MKELAASRKRQPAVISLRQARAHFQILANQPQIPFGYINDCCTGRAHEMCRILQLGGLQPRKVWNYGHGFRKDLPTLRVQTDTAPDGFVTWLYHVAPMIPVLTAIGTVEDMVLDPSLFTDVVMIDEWVARQEDVSSITRKKDAEFIWFNYRNHSVIRDPGFRRTRAQFRKAWRKAAKRR